MSIPFFDRPILNSPYAAPARHWELDDDGQPTQQIIEHRRSAKFITPIPKPKKRKATATQPGFVFDEGVGLSTAEQQYDATSNINEVLAQIPVKGRAPKTGYARDQFGHSPFDLRTSPSTTHRLIRDTQ